VEQLGKIIPGVFQRHMLRSDGATVHVIASLWSEIVGKHVAGRSRPVFLHKGKLVLESDWASWAIQLQQMSRQLCAKINDFLGRDLVLEIEIKLIPEMRPRVNEKAAVPGPEAEFAVDPHLLPETSGLDAEMAKLVSESFVKYFARPKRMVD
jgi:hypothetical protein